MTITIFFLKSSEKVGIIFNFTISLMASLIEDNWIFIVVMFEVCEENLAS